MEKHRICNRKLFDARCLESGNVLFLILIAVALFAALSFAVTRGNRGSEANLTNEEYHLMASQIVQFGTGLEAAVLRVRMINGCEDTDISFYMPGISELSSQQHAPEVSDDCKVFHPDGGGMIWRNPENEDWFVDGAPFERFYFNGDNAVQDIGTTAADLLLMIANLPKEACMFINDRLGVDNNGTDPPADGVTDGSAFTGTYDTTPTQMSTAEIDGKRAACVYDSGNTNYRYYHVLVER